MGCGVSVLHETRQKCTVSERRVSMDGRIGSTAATLRRDLGGRRQRLEVHIVVIGPGAGAAAREAQILRHGAVCLLLGAASLALSWFVPRLH